MKKLFSVVALSLIFCLGFFHAITSSIAIAQVDSLRKSELANYRIGRYVFGSGGVIGATSPNQRHHATVGQTFVGGAHSTNHFLRSGFWLAGGGPVGIQSEEPVAMPTEFKLHQNYPNPFNPETTIAYDLPGAFLVTVEIFNTVGQRIRLVSSHVQGPGQAIATWDGRNDQGQAMVSGMYFYQVTASALENKESNQHIQFQETKKMLLVK